MKCKFEIKEIHNTELSVLISDKLASSVWPIFLLLEAYGYLSLEYNFSCFLFFTWLCPLAVKVDNFRKTTFRVLFIFNFVVIVKSVFPENNHFSLKLYISTYQFFKIVLSAFFALKSSWRFENTRDIWRQVILFDITVEGNKILKF